MARSQSSLSKLTPVVAALLLALAMSSGCAPMPRDARVAYAAPALIEMSPGIWAVQDYPGYYYANGGYWYFADDGLWYQRPYWGGPWAGVEVRKVPRGIPGRAGFPEPEGVAHSDGALHAEYSPATPSHGLERHR